MNIERIKAIRQLQQYMMDYTYQHQQRIIADQMLRYALENQRLLGCSTNTFIYNGIWYSAGDFIKIPPGSDYRPNRMLHPDIRDKINALFRNEFETKVQQGTLQIYFGQVLITARTTKDLHELLPYPLHPILKNIDSTFDCGPSLSQQEIEQFHQKNEDGIRCLHEMLFLRLLHSK